MHPKSVRRNSRIRVLRRITPAVLGLAVLGTTPDAHAIIRRADVSDSLYLALGNDAKYIGVLSVHDATQTMGSGILISPKWVLTAGHVALAGFGHGAPATVNVGGTSDGNGTNFSTLQWFSPYTGSAQDGSDIGLIQLSSAVTSITPSSRYYFATDTSLTGTYVGYGDPGTGLTGAGFESPRLKRGMQNTIDALGTAIGSGSNQFSSKTILSDFDDPGNADGYNAFGSTSPLGLEGLISGGDSGGGVFVDLNGRTYLNGVNSFVVALGTPFGNGGNPNSNPPGFPLFKYADVTGATRVTSHNTWIDDNITNSWKTGSSGMFGDATQWNVGTYTSGAPTNYDLAGFNVLGTYTVTFGGSVSNHMLLARRGDVTLDLAGSTYNLTSTMYEGALVVGRYSGNDASVTFRNGTINSGDTILGQLPGAMGRLKIGPSATLNVTGNAYVGGDFNGIAGSGILTIGNTTSAMNVSGTLKVTGNGVVSYDGGALSANTLDIGDGGQVLLAPGGNKIIKTNNLLIAGSGLINMSDNDMVITYGASPNAQMRQWLINGNIFSTSQSANTGLGYGDNAVLGRSTFDGMSVGSNTEFVKYTYFGDADLDGDVDASDLARFAQSWQANSEWIGGDFNYDGKTNILDLILLAVNWQMGVGAPLAPSFGDALAAAGLPVELTAVAVPEPTVFASLLLAAPLFLRRRRQH